MCICKVFITVVGNSQSHTSKILDLGKKSSSTQQMNAFVCVKVSRNKGIRFSIL